MPLYAIIFIAVRVVDELSPHLAILLVEECAFSIACMFP
jgi:hypothetical protein